MRGEGGVAGEVRVVGVPKFHSWGKCTMPLTNINSDWMSIASFGLCIYAGPLFRILECNLLDEERLGLQIVDPINSYDYLRKCNGV